MGLYDTVHSRFPLPHHQDTEYQTKDIEHLVGGLSGLGGSLSEYEITPEGGLRVRVHEREWRDDPEWFDGGYLESVNDWWEDIPDVGTSASTPGTMTSGLSSESGSRMER